MQNITIIGSGLGGLTSGALLAKQGYKVTLLEQHYVVGGCATTFNRKGGFICEVGLHEMEGVHSNPQVKNIFDKLDVYKHVEFVKPDEFFSIETKNGTFLMPDGTNEAILALIKRFPNQKKNIQQYFALLKNISDEFEKLQSASWYHYLIFPILFSNILRYKSKTVSQVLNDIIEDEELKLILNSNIQYYNDTPDTLSFLLHCIAQHSYFTGGGWFIKGGSQKLSDYLASVITDNGGEVIKSAHVTHCDESHVTYTKKKEKITIHTNIIVSNLSPKQTYKLFDKEFAETKEIADSLLTIYLGFSKNLKDTYGKRPYSNFIFDQLTSIDDYNNMLKKDIDKRGFVFVDYSQVDSALTKDANKSFAVICMTDFLDEWKDLNEEEYKEKKQNLIEKTLSKLETYYPNIKEYVEYAEVGTARTVQNYIKTPKGTAYGYKATPEQFFKIPKSKSSKIDNLYFVGQWVIAGGFSPAIMSGFLSYEEILKRTNK